MFTKVLPKHTQELLVKLGKSEILAKAYLAGGTALALQLGHRVSVDLDFFTQHEFDVDQTINQLKDIAPFNLDCRSWQTIVGKLDKTKFSLFFYEYKLIDKQIDYEGIKLVGIKDIAAMKINAISDRGLKRDFIDLYFIMQEGKLSLEEILKLYDKKYGKLAANKLHILKSLTYFADAEDDKTVKMLVSVEWEKVKKYVVGEVKKIMGKYKPTYMSFRATRRSRGIS